MENRQKEKKEYIDISIVKTLMAEKNIDEKEMAARMGITLPTLKRFLNGADQSYMRADTVIKISRILNVNPPVIIHKDYH